MTGYGQFEVQCSDFSLNCEIKSYNNRFLEIAHNFPYFISPYEIEIDNAIKKVCQRGHIDVWVRVKRIKSDSIPSVDESAVLLYKEAFEKIRNVAGIDKEAGLGNYLAMEGVINPVKSDNAEQYREPLFRALGGALDQLDEFKEKEGGNTLRDLEKFGSRLKEGLAFISENASRLEDWCKSTLLEKFNELLGQKGYDENRVLQEVAVMLVKYTVNEEIVRMGAHLREYDNLLSLNEPVGKRLDFLTQEMNREINTIASKSQIVEINHCVVSMKDSLENIREQIRNIE